MKTTIALVSLVGMLFSTAAYGQMKVTLYQDVFNYSEPLAGELMAVAGGTPNLASVINQSAYSTNTSGTLGGQYSFQTFCIEANEAFATGTPYNVSISPNAMYGNQPPLGDPVSIGTAWLYSQFAAGTLTGLTAGNVAAPYDYTYGAGRVASATDLQQTIWWLEDEPVGAVDPGNSNVFRNAVLAEFGSAANAEANANGAYGVEALNVGGPGAIQDQLVIVPEPTAAALLIAGSMLMLAARRISSSRKVSEG